MAPVQKVIHKVFHRIVYSGAAFTLKLALVGIFYTLLFRNLA